MKEGEENRPVWLPLLAYAALVTILALTHDVWRDEVRALSVATKAASWPQMVSNLHEEGHPVIWYALLRAGYAITHSPLVLPVLAALIGVATAYLILRFAPFTRWSRLLAVFGAFLAYELSVVARNYGIGVLCMLAACVSFRARAERPWPLALSLALLANTSVHGAVASALLLVLWSADLLEPSRRRHLLRLPALAAVALVVAGILIALATARPPADVSFSFSFSSLHPSAIAQAILTDPGYGLKGARGADLVAAGEIPWERFSLDSVWISRILVNVAVLSVAWGLRRDPKSLALFVCTILAFEILFRIVYPAGLRHEALLAFLVISLCWIAIENTTEADRTAARRRISLGLLPLLALQTAALPFMAWRHIQKPESMGQALARVIATTPRFSTAVLMSEPGALMETLPYYVANQVFMPRQREFDYRAYFARGTAKQKLLTLTELLAIADSVGCVTRSPVLLSIGHRQFIFRKQGEVVGPFGTVFRWTPDEKSHFALRARSLRFFRGATSDENYRTYELGPGQC